MVKRTEKHKPAATSENRPYYVKYLASGASLEDSGEATFLTFLENLNACDWQDLLADLIQQKAEIWDIFRPPLGDDLSAHAAVFLDRVGSATRNLMKEAINRLVFASSAKPDERFAEKQLIPLLSFCRLLHEPCDPASLAQLVTDRRFNSEVRLMAAQILSNQPQSLPLDYWQRLDVKSTPELLPVVISALAAHTPKLALQALKQIDKVPAQRDRLEYPLRLALRQLLRSDNGITELSTSLGEMPQWAAREVRRVLQLAEFAHVQVGGLESSTIHSTVEAYLAGRKGLAEIRPTKRLNEIVENTLANWRPLATGEVQRSLRLIKLARRFPTAGSLRSGISSLEAILQYHSYGREVPKKSTLRLSKEILRFMAENSLVLIRAREDTTTPQARELVTSYRRALQRALRFQELAPIAFEQLSDYTQERGELVSATRNAIREGHLRPEDCDRILRKFYSPEASANILQETIVSKSVISRELAPEEVFDFGAKMYKFNPVFIFDEALDITDEERILIQDAAVVHTFAEFASDFTGNSDI